MTTKKELNKIQEYMQAIMEEIPYHFSCGSFDDSLEFTAPELMDVQGGIKIQAYGTLEWAKGSGHIRKCLQPWLDRVLEEVHKDFAEEHGLDINEPFPEDILEAYYEYEDEVLKECGFYYNIYLLPSFRGDIPQIMCAAWIDMHIDMYKDPTPYEVWKYTQGLIQPDDLQKYDRAMSHLYSNSIRLQDLEETSVEPNDMACILVDRLEGM